MTALEAQWTPVQHLILGEDPQLRLYAEVSVWFKKIEFFRKGEDERMFLQQPTPEDLVVHRSLLQRLITDGDHLKSLIHDIGLPENIEGIKPEDVSAMIETLRDTYRGWHEPVPAQQREQVLREVFPDVA
jgi:hypothetical protein